MAGAKVGGRVQRAVRECRPDGQLRVDDAVGSDLDADDLVADELVVEEISIDGMCGVY